jgi:formylglycine-generating enzyme required for sulfatase activity
MRRFVLLMSTVVLLACAFGVAVCAQVLAPERERALQPNDSFRECDICPEMVVIPGGAFTMGSPSSEPGRDKSEGPQHVVTFSRPLAVGKFEVTMDQFAAFVTETGHAAGSRCWTIENGKAEEKDGRSWRNPGYSQTGSHPASCLSWNDAKAYVAWLSRKTEKGYRLLAESEWEYAARARTRPGPAPRYVFGDDDNAICRYGNAADQTARRSGSFPKDWTVLACSDGHATAAPVGSFAANGFGLYDVLGNVWEWTEDCWNGSYRGAPANGSAWTSGDCGKHVLRGGAWDDHPKYLRAAERYWGFTGDRGIMGIRVARTLASP